MLANCDHYHWNIFVSRFTDMMIWIWIHNTNNWRNHTLKGNRTVDIFVIACSFLLSPNTKGSGKNVVTGQNFKIVQFDLGLLERTYLNLSFTISDKVGGLDETNNCSFCENLPQTFATRFLPIMFNFRRNLQSNSKMIVNDYNRPRISLKITKKWEKIRILLKK